jgi:DNA-binding XRE family transcriptional regulator
MTGGIHEKRFEQISQRFKMVRQLLDLTTESMAKQLNLKEADSIQEIEQGNIDIPQLMTIVNAMEKIYGLNPRRILYGTGFIFVKKGPGITDEFYEKHTLLFHNMSSPGREELMELMGCVPVIETILLGKLVELKVICSDEIKAFKLDE